MDILKRVAKKIESMVTELNLRSESFRVEIEESNSDIKEAHFLLDWKPGIIEARNTADSENSFENYFPDTSQTFLQALPITLVFKSKSSGQTWRQDMLRYTTEFNMMFYRPISFETLGPGLFNSFELNRDPDSDVLTKIVENNMDQGFSLEQHWTGHILHYTKRDNYPKPEES